MEIGGPIIEEDSQVMRELSNAIELLIKSDFTEQTDHPNKFYCILSHFVNVVFYRIPFICKMAKKGELSCELCMEYKATIMFALCILIMGISFDGAELPFFWKKRMQSTNILDQMEYLFANYETMIHRGPLVCMAKMAIAQTSNKSNRGLYKDCLHSLYMPYCTLFFTNDQHFIEIKSQPPMGYWDRIINIEQFINKIQQATEKS